MKTQSRKHSHVDICLKEEVELGCAGFCEVEFIHNALPEANLAKINTSTDFFGKNSLKISQSWLCLLAAVNRKFHCYYRKCCLLLCIILIISFLIFPRISNP
jgi:hypothetical protein